jgi:N-acetylglucosamine malate deacetylase 2
MSSIKEAKKFLFIFAHPDDETIGCAGTIALLVKAGHHVKVVLATDGSSGEVSKAAQANFEKFGKDLGKLRRHEFTLVQNLLGFQEGKILDFKDGYITNQDVWGKLTLSIIEEIDTYQPDVLITFDHSGWYFHLDHVAVSIATTLAFHQAEHKPDLFFHNHFRVDSSKWQYVFSETMPITHQVNIESVRQIKFQAMDLHQSQDLNTPRNHMTARTELFETYQLIEASNEGKSSLNEELSIFL